MTLVFSGHTILLRPVTPLPAPQFGLGRNQPLFIVQEDGGTRILVTVNNCLAKLAPSVPRPSWDFATSYLKQALVR